MLLTGLVRSACFIIQSRTTCLGEALPTVAWPSHINHQLRKWPIHRLAYRPIFSFLFFSFLLFFKTGSHAQSWYLLCRPGQPPVHKRSAFLCLPSARPWPLGHSQTFSQLKVPLLSYVQVCIKLTKSTRTTDPLSLCFTVTTTFPFPFVPKIIS